MSTTDARRPAPRRSPGWAPLALVAAVVGVSLSTTGVASADEGVDASVRPGSWVCTDVPGVTDDVVLDRVVITNHDGGYTSCEPGDPASGGLWVFSEPGMDAAELEARGDWSCRAIPPEASGVPVAPLPPLGPTEANRTAQVLRVGGPDGAALCRRQEQPAQPGAGDPVVPQPEPVLDHPVPLPTPVADRGRGVLDLRPGVDHRFPRWWRGLVASTP